MKRLDKPIRLRRSMLISSAGAVLILLLIFCAVTMLEFFFLDDVYLARAKRSMRLQADQLVSIDLSDVENQILLSNIESKSNFYIEIYDEDQKLVYTSTTNPTSYDPANANAGNEKKPRILRTTEHHDVDESSFYEIRQEYYAASDYLVFGKTASDGRLILLFASIETLNTNAKDAFWVFFGAEMALVALVLGLLLIHILTFSIPVDKISHVTKGMAQMDFTQVCPPFRFRELNELSRNINSLSASLDMTMRTLKRRNALLENEIKKEKELLEIRKTFIANASHELKTPIAVIQGYAEGLKYGIYRDNPEECYDVILEESHKLNELVLEMLEESRVNSPKLEPRYERLALFETITQSLDQMQSIFLKNGIHAICEIDPTWIARCDKGLFERILSNYLSNAVSHCAGEKQIVVSAASFGECYRISVFNTGEQIASEDLEQIWTSFYRADKARSRKEGRFGLGLSIVKAAQELQNLQYGVINHENGVEFWFDILRAE